MYSIQIRDETLTYETRADQIQKVVAAIRAILRTDEGVDQEFMLIRLTDFAGYAGTSCSVTSPRMSPGIPTSVLSTRSTSPS